MPDPVTRQTNSPEHSTPGNAGSRPSETSEDSTVFASPDCDTLAAIFRESPAAMALWRGPEHVFEIVNPAYQAIFEDRELVGRTFAEALPEFAADGYPKLLTGVLETGEPYTGHDVLAHISRNEGRWSEDRYFDFTYQRIDDVRGAPYGVCVHAIDVTDRVLARRQLEQSEEQLKLALRGARMGTWSFLLSENKIICDEKFREIHDVAEGDDVEEIIECRLHPDDRERVRAELDAALRNGTAYSCEYRLLNPDGSSHWVYARGEPKYDETDTAISISGVTFDIDDRRRAEEERRTLAAVAENTEDFIGICRPDMRVFFINRAGRRLVGLDESDVPRTTVLDYFAHEEHARIVDEVVPAVRGTGSWKGELLFRHFKTGEQIPVLYNIFPIRGPDAEEIIAYATVTRDLRKEQEATRAIQEREARFRQLADTVPQMVWVTKADGFHEYYNRRWYEFTGVPEGSTDGAAWNGMFHPDDQAAAWERWRHSLDTGEPYEIEYRLRHHSGEYRWTLGRALPIRNERGEIERWFGTCTDIHAMKRLTAEREELLASERRARAEAERASHLKDEFLATLSHELRTPLSAILGWTQVMRRAPLPPDDLARGLETIERNARMQSQLIEDLLDMSRIISGKLHLDVQPLQLGPLVESAIETVTPAAHGKAIRIERMIDPFAGACSGDANRLQQVVWNLLSNAIKFTPSGGTVRVSLRRMDSQLELTVSDTGQGIAADFLPRVFDRFLQADSSTTRKYGGLGLGLAIVKQLVELHGGTVSVASPGENQGTTFTVRLPAAAEYEHRAPGHRGDRRASSGESAQWTRADLDGLKVLVVDDEPDAREFLRRMLEDSNAKVLTAASADAGLDVIKSQRPDVLVSDIGMVDVDGYEFLRRVRALDAEEGGRIPAIALTAFGRSEDRTKALLAGYLAHLVKPADPTELMATIAAVAGRTGARR